MSTAAVAQNLLAARKAKNWTRVRLGAESGVHPNTIADIERGRNQAPAFDKVIRLSRALQMPAEQLYPVPELPS